MIKKIITLFCLLYYVTLVQGQNALKLDTIIVCDNVSKPELYKRAKLWFFEQVREDGIGCIQYEDKDEGIIFGRSSSTFSVTNTATQWVNKLSWVPYVGKKAKKINDVTSWTGLSGILTAAIEIRIKEGKCKVSMSHIIHKSYADDNPNDMSMGIIYDDVPDNLGILKQKQYDALMGFALPAIGKWWDDIVASITSSLIVDIQDENW